MPASPDLSPLRTAILHALGLTLAAACTSRPLGDSADAATGEASGGGSTAAATTTAVTTTTATTTTATTTAAGTTVASTSGADTTTASGSSGGSVGGSAGGSTGTTGAVDPSTSMPATSFDTTAAPDLPCANLADLGTPLEPADVVEFKGCEDSNPSECYDYVELCVALPEGARSCDACAPACLDALPPLCNELSIRQISCGPFQVGDKCCHVVEYSWNCTDGRPFLVDGTARTASRVRAREWLAGGDVAAREPVRELDDAGRSELAALWTADALAEHASVASFARFTLQLLAHAAPPELVQQAVAAQTDEVAHARVAFALASMYAGAPVGPGPLPIGGALDGPHDLVALVTAVALEGCVGETLAAAELDLASRTCSDPALAATLRRIAADEQRHAELAWRTVRWAIARGGPPVREAAREAFAAAACAPPPPDRLPAALLRRHGRLPASERATLAATCLREVIRPCAAALLATPPRAAA